MWFIIYYYTVDVFLTRGCESPKHGVLNAVNQVLAAAFESNAWRVKSEEPPFEHF